MLSQLRPEKNIDDHFWSLIPGSYVCLLWVCMPVNVSVSLFLWVCLTPYVCDSLCLYVSDFVCPYVSESLSVSFCVWVWVSMWEWLFVALWAFVYFSLWGSTCLSNFTVTTLLGEKEEIDICVNMSSWNNDEMKQTKSISARMNEWTNPIVLPWLVYYPNNATRTWMDQEFPRVFRIVKSTLVLLVQFDFHWFPE